MKTKREIIAVRLSLGNRIRLLRDGQHLSQYKFCDMISMDRSYLIGIEKGRRNFTIDSLCKISQGLGMSVSEVCEGVDDPAAIEEYLELLRQMEEEAKAKEEAEEEAQAEGAADTPAEQDEDASDTQDRDAQPEQGEGVSADQDEATPAEQDEDAPETQGEDLQQEQGEEASSEQDEVNSES